jgi:hypothetical protein
MASQHTPSEVEPAASAPEAVDRNNNQKSMSDGVNSPVSAEVEPAAATAPEAVDRNNNQSTTTAAFSDNLSVLGPVPVDPAPVEVQCRILPHGPLPCIIALLSIFAWVVGLSKDGCNYARIDGPNISEITNNPNVPIPYVIVGFQGYREPILNPLDGEWIFDYDLKCLEYSTDEFKDGTWMFAYCTSFLCLIIGGSGALFILFSTCFVFERNVWRWAGYELLVAAMLQLLTYIWFATSVCRENKCVMHYGARADLVTTFFWITSAILILGKYPIKKNDPTAPTQQGREEIELSNRNAAQLPVAGVPTQGPTSELV